MGILLKYGFLGDPHDPKSIETSVFLKNAMIMYEMVIASIAFSMVFKYQDFFDWMQQPKPILSNLSKVY
jgi:hypothetical protein